MKVCAIIPSLNPDERLLRVLDGLMEKGFKDIILVDDGSREETKHFFVQAQQKSGCVVLKHHKNLGKGRALKTAFNYFLNNYPDYIGVVTADADDQHTSQDILNCAKALEENPNSLILGVRNFDLEHVPWKSRMGNKITAFSFKALCGIRVSDTQTGLRAIPSYYAREFLDLFGERFEYETNMLLEIRKKNIDVKEIQIDTVYINQNASTHFHPLRDSIRIYSLIFKFLGASLASTLCDLLLFALFKFLLRSMVLEWNLFIATAGARIISSIFNYSVNKTLVFTNKGKIRSTLAKYYAVCIVQGMLSYFGVLGLVTIFSLPSVLSKVIVDFILFLITFQIQREWVFKNK